MNIKKLVTAVWILGTTLSGANAFADFNPATAPITAKALSSIYASASTIVAYMKNEKNLSDLTVKFYCKEIGYVSGIASNIEIYGPEWKDLSEDDKEVLRFLAYDASNLDRAFDPVTGAFPNVQTPVMCEERAVDPASAMKLISANLSSLLPRMDVFMKKYNITH